MKRQIRFRVHGRVQGVWFRQSTLRRARELGIAGWVANCPDGTVEGVAQGEEESLLSFEGWLHSGPPLAEVLKVDVTRESLETVFEEFSNKGSGSR